MISLTVTEASRHFLDLVRRVCAGDEEAVLNDDGRPVVRLVPVAGRLAKGGVLADAWTGMKHLGEEEAAAFEQDLDSARGRLSSPISRWD